VLHWQAKGKKFSTDATIPTAEQPAELCASTGTVQNSKREQLLAKGGLYVYRGILAEWARHVVVAMPRSVAK